MSSYRSISTPIRQAILAYGYAIGINVRKMSLSNKGSEGYSPISSLLNAAGQPTGEPLGFGAFACETPHHVIGSVYRNRAHIFLVAARWVAV